MSKDIAHAQTLQQKDYFILKECAQKYILSGKPLAEICDHNEKIARNIGKHNVSMLWQFVKIIYSSMPPKQNADPFRNVTATQNLLMTNRMMMNAPNAIPQHWVDDLSDEQLTHTNEVNNDEINQNHFVTSKSGELNKLTTIQSNNENGAIDALNNIVYGDSELTVEHMDCIKSLRNGFLYIGPHDLTKNFAWPCDSLMNHDMQENSRQNALSRNRRDTSPVKYTKIFHSSISVH